MACPLNANHIDEEKRWAGCVSAISPLTLPSPPEAGGRGNSVSTLALPQGMGAGNKGRIVCTGNRTGYSRMFASYQDVGSLEVAVRQAAVMKVSDQPCQVFDQIAQYMDTFARR